MLHALAERVGWLGIWSHLIHGSNPSVRYSHLPEAVQETYRTLTAPAGVRFEGFKTRAVPDFFREHYPDIPVVDGRAATERTVVVRKHQAPADDVAGYAFAFDQLADLYRINTLPIDLSQL